VVCSENAGARGVKKRGWRYSGGGRIRARSATHAPAAGPKLAAQASSSKIRRSQIFYARNSVCFAHAGDASAQKTMWRFGDETAELKGRRDPLLPSVGGRILKRTHATALVFHRAGGGGRARNLLASPTT
jgi:hypothetical protein